MIKVEEHGDIITAVLQDSLIEILIDKKLITQEEIELVFNERLSSLKEDLKELKKTSLEEIKTSDLYFGPTGEA